MTRQHPFLVDQTPFLHRRLSDMSFQSSTSAGTSASTSTSGSDGSLERRLAPAPQIITRRQFSSFSTDGLSHSSSHSSIASTASSARSVSRPSAPSLAPPWQSPYQASPPQTSPAQIAPSPAGVASPLLPPPRPRPPASPQEPIDRHCLQWMREAEQHEHYFGSVAARAPMRGPRRLLPFDERGEAFEARSI